MSFSPRLRLENLHASFPPGQGVSPMAHHALHDSMPASFSPLFHARHQEKAREQAAQNKHEILLRSGSVHLLVPKDSFPTKTPVESTEQEKIRALLSTPPFSHLPPVAPGDPLLASMKKFEYKDGDHVIFKGDHNDTRVYLLVEGQVILADVAKPSRPLESFVNAPGVFGEWSPVCHKAREHDVIAASEKVVVFAIDFLAYQDLFRKYINFRYALIRKIQLKRRVFDGINNFAKVVLGPHQAGVLNFQEILEAYKQLRPALHQKMNERDIDVDAWIYAIRRLPINVTSVYVFLMCSEIPTIYLQKSIVNRSVESPARRRPCFSLGDGKNLILIREDFTDLLDFISLLCVHCVEAEKLRKKLAKPNIVADLIKYVAESDQPETTEIQDLVLAKLQLSPHETKGLKKIWEKDLLSKLWELVRNHEDYVLKMELKPHYATDAQERWAEQIRQKVRLLTGSDCFDDYTVDIISSNTHSVVNCLCHVLQREKRTILDWGRENTPILFESSGFKTEDDLLYAIAYQYEKNHPDFAAKRFEELRTHGIERISFTEFTGIAVDVILLDKIEDTIDSMLKKSPNVQKRLLINIDYAFGQQAESIMAALTLLFGRTIRSVNIIGKAGGLDGNRGDIVIASEVVMQRDNEILPIKNEGISVELLGQSCGRSVRLGPVLTVNGTVIQDRDLLMFFKEFFRCTALEMEGSYYAKVLKKNKEIGILKPDAAERFLYYISDLPLHPESNLSATMAPGEGIPPLYAVTRAVLEQVLL